MGFVPVHFSIADSSALKADLSNTFQFAPPCETILLAKAHNVTDPSPYGDGFNFLALPDYLNVHRQLCRFTGLCQGRSTTEFSGGDQPSAGATG